MKELEIDEEEIEELRDKTGFNTQHEIEALKAMLSIAEDMHKSGTMIGLSETREAIKKSVNELCDFFKKFVSCL